MHLGSSFDENGPMTSLGEMSFSAETGLPGGRQIFEVPVFIVSSDEATVIVEYNGLRLTSFGTMNDYYGFGTSPQTALLDAKEKLEILEGINADICVVATIKRRPCFPSQDAPFYRGSQRVHYIPMNWRHENDQCAEAEEEFLVWQNGQRTPEALTFYDRIIQLSSEDAAPSRNGDLRTVATRKSPTQRDKFMLTEHELA